MAPDDALVQSLHVKLLLEVNGPLQTSSAPPEPEMYAPEAVTLGDDLLSESDDAPLHRVRRLDRTDAASQLSLRRPDQVAGVMDTAS